LASLIVSMIKNRNPSSEDIDRFRKEASPEVGELMNMTVKDALYIMALNSPILVTFGAIVALLLWTVSRLNKMLVYRQAEHFVDELPSKDSEQVPQPA